MPIFPPAARVWATQMLIVHGRMDRARRPSLFGVRRSGTGGGVKGEDRGEGVVWRGDSVCVCVCVGGWEMCDTGVNNGL